MQGKKIIDSSFLAVEEYNADGTISIQSQLISKKTRAIIVDSFFYNDGGLLVKQTIENKGGKPFVINTIHYDSRGLDTGSYSYIDPSIKGARNSNARKEYDNAGRLTRKYLQWDDKNPYLAEIYAYDTEGRLAEVNNYNENGQLLYATLYEYQDNNDRKIVYRKKPDGKIKYMVYYYNKQGRCTRISWFLGENTWEHRFLYNPDGTLFEYTTLKAKKQETHRHYYSKD
jgi:hypothetical protein